MTNPLTGDHDVVMQVSVGTLNRVLASLHQNGLAQPAQLPTVPHSAFVRLGDDPAKRVDGVEGVVRVQSGVPQLELIHRSQDRVRVHVVLRARFTPNSGSAPFPEFTYGTLRAEFGIRELPQYGTPGTPAFLPAGPTYLPPRFHFDVDPHTVTFTSFGDTTHDPEVARQAVLLLQTAFTTAGGQPLLDVLMQQKLISLVGPEGQVVAVGVERGPGTPAIEQPKNINRILTGGRDFAVAASSEFALSLLQPHLDALRQSHPVVHVDVFVSTVDYILDFNPTARWTTDTTIIGGVTMPCGAIDLTIDGRATTTSVLPDCTFTIRDRLLIAFNPANQLLILSRKGPADIQAHVLGIGVAESVVESRIAAQYNPKMDQAVQAAGSQLLYTTVTSEVITQQLKLSDDHAAIKLDSAEFSNDGVVVRGSVSLSPRARGVVQFGALNDLTGYGAFLSWFPGGRLTAFAWKWEPPPPAPEGTVLNRAVIDRFVFQPPEGMPGLPPPDGGATVGGRVCVYIQGLVIDPVTGVEKDAFAQDCYSAPDPPPIIIFPIPGLSTAAAEITTPLWTRVGTGREVGIIDASRANVDMPLANTLLVLLTSATPPSDFGAIVEGIDGADREDAGLLVLVVVPAGSLAAQRASTPLDQVPAREAPIRLIEDLGGSWARAFGLGALDSGDALRLIGADGRLVWAHDGTIDAATLSAALREHLQSAGTPALIPQRSGPPVGRLVAGRARRATAYDTAGAADAPDVLTAGDPGLPLTVCFALAWAGSSREQIYRLDERAARGDALVVVVLTDATTDEAAELARDHAPHLIVIPDPDRTITAEHAVWLWPTTITIAPDGLVVSSTTGCHPFDDDVPAMTPI